MCVRVCVHSSVCVRDKLIKRRACEFSRKNNTEMCHIGILVMLSRDN